MRGPDKKKLYPNENIKMVCSISNLPKNPMQRLVNTLTIVMMKKSPEEFLQ